VKLIRADINPPKDFELSQDLPRFSQGNEPPLNLTEKVNRVVMSGMQEAKKNRPKNQKGKTQSPHGNLKDGTSTITPQDKVPEIVSQPSDQKNSAQNAPDTPTPQLPPTHVDGGEEPGCWAMPTRSPPKAAPGMLPIPPAMTATTPIRRA